MVQGTLITSVMIVYPNHRPSVTVVVLDIVDVLVSTPVVVPVSIDKTVLVLRSVRVVGLGSTLTTSVGIRSTAVPMDNAMSMNGIERGILLGILGFICF